MSSVQHDSLDSTTRRTSSRSTTLHVDDLGSALPETVSIKIGGNTPSALRDKTRNHGEMTTTAAKNAGTELGVVVGAAAPSKRKTPKSLVIVAAVLTLALVSVANLTIMGILIDRGVPTTANQNVLVVKGTGSIAQVAVAKQVFPLGLAAYMTHDELMAIDKLMLTRHKYDPESGNTTNVKEVFTVLGYAYTSPQHLVFRTDGGDELAILHGVAWLFEKRTMNAGEEEGSVEDLPTRICSTNAECSRLTADGVDLEALHARAALASPFLHKRALAQAEGECSDPTELVEALSQAIGQLTTDLQASANDMSASSLVGDYGQAVIDTNFDEENEGLEEQVADGAITSDDLSDRRMLSLRTNRKVHWKEVIKYGLHRTNAAFRDIEAPAEATSSQCRSTKRHVDDLLTEYEKLPAASDAIAEQLDDAITACDKTIEARDKLAKAKRNFGTIEKLLGILGKVPVSPINTIAKALKVPLKTLKESADKGHKLLDPFVTTKITGGLRIKPRLQDLEAKNDKIKEKLMLAQDTFHHYGYKVVLLADQYCTSFTSESVCTDELNSGLVAVKQAIPNDLAIGGLPDLEALTSLSIPSMPVPSILVSMENFLMKKRCFWFFGRHCFRIYDVFNNWLFDFVSSIIDPFFSPLERLLGKIFEGIGFPLPELPSVNVPDALPDINFNSLNVPCLAKPSWEVLNKEQSGGGSYFLKDCIALPQLEFTCPARMSTFPAGLILPPVPTLDSSPGANGKSNMDMCQGDCDQDSDCKSGLRCFQRDGYTTVPGCSGTGTSGWDYCARADTVPTLDSSPGANGKSNMDICQGDCDRDSDCKSGLRCFQRDGYTTVPGCSGAGTSGWDYCVRR